MAITDPVWLPPLADLTLLADEIHVWRASLDIPLQHLSHLVQTLSPDERLRAERFYFERDQKRFIVGRGLLRLILSRYLGTEPNQLQFNYGSHGKPTLKSAGGQRMLQFNLSHSQGLALYAIMGECQDSCGVGVDLEYIRPLPQAEQLAKRFFSPREYAAIRSLPPEQRQEAFFKGWTCKEAYLKATGKGLAALEQVEVSLTPSEPAALLSVLGPQAASQWCMYQIEPAPTYVAALAVEGSNWHLRFFQALDFED